MRAVWLALLVGCASPRAPAAVVAQPKPAAATVALGADAILRGTAKTYGELASYRDKGTVTTTFAQHGTQTTDVQHFTTTFERSRWLAFETVTARATWSLWSDATHAYLASPSRAHVDDFGTRVQLPLQELAGVSGSVSMIVPAMLVTGRSRLASLEAPRLLGHATIRGRDCWHLAAPHDETEVWIVERGSTIVRVAQHLHLPQGDIDVRRVIDYEPEPGATISAAERTIPAFASPVSVVPTPAWIGVRFDPTILHAARVTMVVPAAPAARAGIAVGDVIETVEGHAIAEASEATLQLRNAKPGTVIRVGVLRGGQHVQLAVTPEAAPDPDVMVNRVLVGKPATDVDDLRGRVVLLDFWATWCGPCQTSMPKLAALATKHGPNGLRVVGYTDEDDATIAAYRATHAIAYPLVHDEGDTIAGRYLVQGLPQMVLIDRAGVIRKVIIGLDDLGTLEAEIERLLAH